MPRAHVPEIWISWETIFTRQTIGFFFKSIYLYNWNANQVKTKRVLESSPSNFDLSINFLQKATESSLSINEEKRKSSIFNRYIKDL